MTSQLNSAAFGLSRRRCTPFLLILILLLTAYGNSFHASWQMDDPPNIIDNPGVRIRNLAPESLKGAFFANRGESHALSRPLPYLTFALNWYVGQDDPFGYHLVNFAFHVATSWVLYMLIVQLLTVLQPFGRQDPGQAQNVALFAAVLWAVNPVQTQAVTYIVQRMAIMAALFYVLGMLSFVNARAASSIWRRWFYATACLFSFACAMASKENAVLFPVALLLVEWIFFRRGRLPDIRRSKLALGIILGSGLLVLIAFLFFEVSFSRIIEGYDNRPFTLAQRIMTQPRIVLGYLAQLFFPLPARLSIVHDVTLSDSLLHPWTTLPALGMTAIAIGGALAGARKFPLLSLAVLFYFLNHIVESSIIPLELVFEHRNYLPSFFLFLPLAAALQLWLSGTRRHIARRAIAAAIVAGTVFMLGMGTHVRNQAWTTEESLWKDAAVKAPGSMRPLVNLGVQLAWRENPTADNYRHALILFERSLSRRPNRNDEKAEVLGNMAGVHVKQGNHAKAVGIYLEALAINPQFHKNRSDLIKPLILRGRFDQAQLHARHLVDADPKNPDYQNLSGFIYLWQHEPEKALACFQKAISMRPAEANYLMNVGAALTKAGHLERGSWFLKQAAMNAPGDPMPFFALIENRLLADDRINALDYAQLLVGRIPLAVIDQVLNEAQGNHRYIPMDVDRIRPVVYDAMTATVTQPLQRNSENR